MSYIETDRLNHLLENGLKVYRHFLGEVRPGKKILSPLRTEKDPSFSIYVNKSKNLYYWKDYGSGKFGDHWDFIKQKTGLGFRECIHYAKENILALGHFGIDEQRINRAALELAMQPKVTLEKERTKLFPVFRHWNQRDEAFFQSKNAMGCRDMEEAGYLPASEVEVVREDKKYVLFEKENSPLYVICFPSGNFKIYRPLESAGRKWVSNVDREKDFYLFDRCTGGEVLLITAGNRDCAAIRKHLKVDAFALLSETADLPVEVFVRIRSIYNKVFVLYDNDPAGYKGAMKLKLQYGIPYLNDLYKPFKVKDFCQLLEEKRELLEEFTLSFYQKI